jgi:hypothetical protein
VQKIFKNIKTYKMKKQTLSVFGHAQSGSNQRDFYFTPTIKKSIAILLVFLFSITAILKAQEPVVIYRYSTPGTPLGRVLEPGNFIFVRSTAKLYEITGTSPIGTTEPPQSIVASGKFKDYTNGISAQTLHDTVYNYKRPYKVWSGFLTQSGANASVATVLENSIGSIVWSYAGTGWYKATLTGAFTSGKTVILSSPGTVYGDSYTIILADWGSANYIDIYTKGSYDHSYYNGILTGTSIEIRVYQ